jgi:hypothetical protein
MPTMLLAALAFHGMSVPDVSYRGPAERIANLLPKLSREIGTTLTAEPSVANDVVLVSFERRSPREVLDRLAAALHATWIDGKDGKVLTRTTAQQEADRKHDVKLRAEALERLVKLERAKMAKAGKFDLKMAREFFARERGLFDRSSRPGPGRPEIPDNSWLVERAPARRYALELAAAFSKADWMAIPDRRTVFVTKPNAQQRALPKGASRALKAFVEAALAHHKVVAESGLQLGTSFSPMNVPDVPNAEELTTMIVVEALDFDHSLQFVLNVSDKTGRMVVRRQVQLDVNIDGEADLKGIPSKEVPLLEVANATEPLFAYTPMAGGSHLSLMARGGPFDFTTLPFVLPGDPREAPAGTADILRNPLATDPLAANPGAMLDKLARTEGINLIAYLTDRSFLVSTQGLGERAAPSAILDRLGKLGGLESKYRDGWLAITPALPSLARNDALDRGALQEFLAKVKPDSYITLEDVAKFAVRYPAGPTRSQLLSRYIDSLASLYNDQRVTLASFTGGWDSLRLIGLIGDEQRRYLLAGKPITLDGLTPEAREAFRAHFWNAPQTLSMGTANRAGPFDIETGLPKERTTLLEQGIPGSSSVRLISSDEKAVFAIEQSRKFARIMSLDALANARFAAERQPEAAREQLFQVLNRRRLELRLEIRDGLWAKREFTDATLKPDSPIVKFEDLPADLRAEVENRMEKLRKGMAGP